MAKRDHRKGVLQFRFVAIPVPVLESAAYRSLPDSARSLLIDLLMQFSGKNNGRLCTSFVAMQRYGWTSKSKLERAKAALLQAPFIVISRRGRPPNTSEWVGVTWFQLDYERSMDLVPRDWPLNNFQTIESGTIDPNEGRAKQNLHPRIRGDSSVSPRGITPESGAIA